VAFDDFHAYWIGLFVLLAIIVLEWLFGELVVCCHPRLRPVFEMLSTLRTEVTVGVVGRELVLRQRIHRTSMDDPLCSKD
jgi:hypothetical protein